MTENPKVSVIATTISGSMSDWKKVKRVVPLLTEHGLADVALYALDSHNSARMKTLECVSAGDRIIISAGGSGTFNAVLEGCCDSGVPLDEITLGFLRKGSADLIGKTLGMPDTIEDAIRVLADSIKSSRTVRCDVILAESKGGQSPPRHFAGYAGAEIFGEIPYFTENRWTKYYKGILSQLFGDLGPFFVGASLACLRRHIRRLYRRRLSWRVFADDREIPQNRYQACIIVNGDLGKDLPLAKGVPLGSGAFYMFSLKDLGIVKLAGQFKHTWDGSVLEQPDTWGMQRHCITQSLVLQPDTDRSFEIYIDGSTMHCHKSVTFRICDTINILSR